MKAPNHSAGQTSVKTALLVARQHVATPVNALVALQVNTVRSS